MNNSECLETLKYFNLEKKISKNVKSLQLFYKKKKSKITEKVYCINIPVYATL